MSGLEAAAVALAAISAGSGLITAGKAAKEMSRTDKSVRSTTIVLEERRTKHHVDVRGDAVAWANKSGAYAKSTTGQAMAVWSEDYYCKRK